MSCADGRLRRKEVVLIQLQIIIIAEPPQDCPRCFVATPLDEQGVKEQEAWNGAVPENGKSQYVCVPEMKVSPSAPYLSGSVRRHGRRRSGFSSRHF